MRRSSPRITCKWTARAFLALVKERLDSFERSGEKKMPTSGD